MSRARSWLRRGLAFSLYYSGLLWLYAAIRLRRRAVALMYHRVLPRGADSFSADAIVVTPETFARQMSFLRRNFELLDADSLHRCIERGSFPDRGCVVTFDDGWHDNERHALPILLQYRVPAMFFVTTAYVGTASTFWQEEMTRLLFHALRSPDCPAGLLERLGLESARGAAGQDARQRVREVVTGMKSAPIEDIDRLLERLRGLPGIDPADRGDDRFMDWAAVRRLAASPGVKVGSHAHSHLPLTRVGFPGAVDEFRRAQETFAMEGLPRPRVVAYPDGAHDADVVRAAIEAGTDYAFTTRGGHLSPGIDPLRLPRLNVGEPGTATTPEFMCRILGVF